MPGSENEKRDYPIQGRCNARNRNGQPCRKYPVAGRSRCRLHGGLSPTGANHGRYKHGFYTQESIESRKQFRQDMKRFKEILAMM